MTDYPVSRNCNLSTREDETGRLVWQAVTMADAGKLDPHDRDEQRVLDCLETLEETLEEFAEDDSAEAGNTCRAAEEAVATSLRETRVWFLDAFAGERLDAPATAAAMERCDWTNYYPVIDADVRLTGECVYADEEGRRHANYDDQAMIDRAEAVAAGWTIDGDGFATPPEPAMIEVATSCETISECVGLEGHDGACAAYRRAAIDSIEDSGLRWCDPRGQRVLHSQWMGAQFEFSSGAIGTFAFLTDAQRAAIDAADDAGRAAAQKAIKNAGE